MLASVTYEKFSIEWNGDFQTTTCPVELLVGTDHYTWKIIDPRCAVAWNAKSTEPVNVYWERVKPHANWPSVNGTVVLFRHWAAFSWSDLGNAKSLGVRRFSQLKWDQQSKWQKPWQPSLRRQW
jgi:hypothetical protein